jgi:class 3 adenylate cyclase/predicted ATPase
MATIAEWLAALGMSEYAQRFTENDIDVSVLRHLTDQDLKELGVSLGHRRKMLAAIAELSAPAPVTPQPSTPAEPKPRDDAERRQLTVMFTDLVGSTALSTRLDPEDLRSVIGTYHKCVAETVARFDGFVAKYMGDGVLVYLGYPQAHEDDAERAVRTGLALVEAVGKLRVQEPLHVRIGVATGLVVVGDLVGSGEAQERGVVGETPNLAARLQGIAAPNTVVIAEGTRRLLGNLFELQDLGAVDLKGIVGPTRAWVALRATSVESRFEALHTSGLTTLVGREEETELLLRRWARAKTGEGQVVLLSGEAGIGKSRLTAALLERLAAEPHLRLRYFCSPQHTDSAFYPIIGQLERAAGFLHDDKAQARLDKLDAVLAQTSTPTQDTALLADILSIPNDGRYLTFDLTPQQRRQKTLEALISQLEALTRQNPVLMIFEDAHWIDPTSQELLDLVVERVQRWRVLLLITFRPEYQASWTGQAQVTALTLSRLGPNESAALVTRVAGINTIASDLVDEIVRRTDGVPLFLEELTKAVLEVDALAGEDRQLVSRIPAVKGAIPATLHASLMARLDRLDSGKEVAQIGAAIGREFTFEIIAKIAPMSPSVLDKGLRQLVASGLLFRRGTPPTANYTFKHALVQDAAYSSLLRTRRAQLHEEIANVLEELFPNIVSAEPETIAHHLGEAGLVERAVPYWLRAARKAAARSANLEAIGHARRGLEMIRLLTAGLTRDRSDLDFQLVLGPCLMATEGPTSATAVATFTRARELCDQIGDPPEYLQVMHWLAIVRAVRGELAEACEATFSSLARAEARGDRPAVINMTRGLGLVLLLMGRLGQARELTERAVKEFEAASEVERLATRAAGQDAGAASLAVLSWVLWALGEVDAATTRMAGALQRADTLAHPHTQAYVYYYGAVLHALRREPGVARSHAEKCLALSKEHGFSQWRALSQTIHKICATVLHPHSEKLAEARSDLEALSGAGYQMGITSLYVLLSDALLLRGNAETALAVISQGLSISRRNSERLFEAELYRLKGSALLASSDCDTATAALLLKQALTTAGSQSARALELRAATSLTRLWHSQGKLIEGRELLEPIYSWFTEGFNTLDMKEAGTLLRQLN